ncbi:MAG: hypothetical protein GEU73_13805 [Chloroflexi bacterium]|nr:hypothetical protein [Chloroflexota bacterium]
MPAQLKHLAISSNDNERLVSFYTTLFGMTGEGRNAISDGYIGLNLNSRGRGRQAGLDHFGFEVDDAEAIFARVRDDYPEIEFVKRPSNRPFAGISMHDPAGNVFDLSQPGMENRRDVYAQGAEAWRPRHISHVMLRAVDPNRLAAYYKDVFGLRETPTGDENVSLTDGRVAFVIAPWRITDFVGMGIERPALNHIGFAVESVAAFEADLERLVATNPELAPRQMRSPEGDARMQLLASCRYGHYGFADPDGVLLDVHEG